MAPRVWRAESRSGTALKDLERENLRLRKAVADLTLDAMILKEAARENSKPLAPPCLC